MEQEFTILIVDDDYDTRELLLIALQRENWKLITATNGLEAIELCKPSATQQAPDLVLTDYQMPGANGLEVCTWIKQNLAQHFIPVIIVTSQTEICNKTESLNWGADSYVAKPFALSELEAQIRALLRIKTLTIQLEETKNLLAQKEKELLAIQIAGGTAHELGQPITSLLMYCDLLKKGAPTPEQQDEILSNIRISCERLSTTLRALSNLSQFRTKAYLDTRIVDLD